MSLLLALTVVSSAPANAAGISNATETDEFVVSSDLETATQTWMDQEASSTVEPEKGTLELSSTAHDSEVDELSFATNGSQVTVPGIDSDHIVLDDAGESSIGISLPDIDSIGKRDVNSDGTIELLSSSENDADVRVNVFDDGSVSLHTIIPTADSSNVYEYDLLLPAGTTATPQDGGSILFLDTEGEMIGAVAPPWAKDANDEYVATDYEYRDGVLRQRVFFDETTTFPVTADPWLGKKIFRKISVDRYKSHPRVNLDLSGWGASIYSGLAQGGGAAGIAAGQAILRKAGWTEATNYSSSVKKALLGKATMKQQFDCHALGAAFAGQWNLERFRPTRTKHWTFGVARHHCNWTTANRY
ncbi:hypothetical protein [Zhihengliuella halotolerans]|uniref:hypothetical protein n=1 Tax=Zhihengliuella halotolerans TaxID=370736 RepID=UPI000C80F72D|nr:hypothetical protein [Zhihengliuella halotolerans]